jgi:hypothetical protein
MSSRRVSVVQQSMQDISRTNIPRSRGFKREAWTVLENLIDQYNEGQETDEEDISYEIDILLEDVKNPHLGEILRTLKDQNYDNFWDAANHLVRALAYVGMLPEQDDDEATVTDNEMES